MDFAAATTRNYAAETVCERLAATDLNTLTPMAALNLLFEIKEIIE